MVGKVYGLMVVSWGTGVLRYIYYTHLCHIHKQIKNKYLYEPRSVGS